MIDGYKGIMPLDINNIKPEHRKQAIECHYKDIEKYKLEQCQLKPELRYENTILRIKKQHEFESMHINKRAKNRRLEQEQKDKKVIS